MTSNRAAELKALILPATIDTLTMVFYSSFFAIIIGTVLGIVLYLSKPGSLRPNRFLNFIIGAIVNIGRSMPFIILIIIIIPFTKLIAGSSIGNNAFIVSLTIAAIPFVARIMEASFAEVDSGVIEAAKAMGASVFQIVTRVLLPESSQSIISNITITVINIVGYSAMAGTVGGTGLGPVAIRYGYVKFQADTLFFSVLILIIFVQLIQTIGSYASNNIVNLTHTISKWVKKY
ncbi:MAG: ABC transporter permease [Clostridiales bacterium]|jgi:D-methionine transport system permease protein|nr:ABC transporter permease [Clostridiales bacterium]